MNLIEHHKTKDFVLNNCSIFENLTPKQKKEIQNLLKIEEFKEKQFLVREGDKSLKVFILIKGKAEVLKYEKNNGERLEHVIANLGPNDIIGDLAIIDNQFRSADVRAIVAVVAASIDLNDLPQEEHIEIPLVARIKLNCAINNSYYLRSSNIKTLSDGRKHRHEVLKLKNYDVVTGLPNQHFLSEKLKERLEKFPHKTHVLYQIEITEYKEIADAMGIEFSDSFLNEFSGRLSKLAPNDALIARVGTNQFMVLTSSIQDIEEAPHVAKKILNMMLSSIPVKNEDVYIHGYIGISRYPEDGKTEVLLMKNAGLALDAAKLEELNSFSFYDPALNEAVETRRKLIKDFRNAMQEDQFEIYYQPQFSLRNQKLIGAEALIRWPHPEQGMIPPSSFIPIVEQSGLIVPLGNWILKMTCAQVQMWEEANIASLPRIAVNLSALQFRQKNFIETMKEIVNSSCLTPDRIELEITENVMMKDMDDSVHKFKKLADMGFVIAIDDFGTGYSSLSYLRRLPIHKLKIDQSFVKELLLSDEAKDIVRCIIALAKSLKLITIAEGIENKIQADFLLETGCDEGQGYMFSKPISVLQFEKLFLLKRSG